MLAQVFPEGFETGVPPTDWTSFRGANSEGDVYDWTTSTSAASGSQAAYVRYENVANEAEDWLVTPQFPNRCCKYFNFSTETGIWTTLWVSLYNSSFNSFSNHAC